MTYVFRPTPNEGRLHAKKVGTKVKRISQGTYVVQTKCGKNLTHAWRMLEYGQQYRCYVCFPRWS